MTQLDLKAMKSKPGLIEEEVRKGAGSILNYYDSAGMNRLQKIALEQSRLKILLILGNDVIYGHRTIFPISLASSCSWNLELVKESGRIAAEETRANGWVGGIKGDNMACFCVIWGNDNGRWVSIWLTASYEQSQEQHE